jgi:hypothetical protein
VEGIHGLQGVAASTFSPTVSRNKDTWWKMNVEDSPNIHPHRDEQSEDELGGTEYVWDSSDEEEEGDTKKTCMTFSYMWDSMDEEDREDSLDNLNQSDKWDIWKSKDRWSISLKGTVFHQLLYIHKDTQDERWGSKIEGWSRTADIRVKKPKKRFVNVG